MMGDDKDQSHQNGFRPPPDFGGNFDFDDEEGDDEEFEMTGTPFN
jgi:hypothetical protein